MTLHTICCLGDSQTQCSPVYAVPPERMWVEQTAVKLRGLGANTQARSYGIGGQTTGQMLNRVDILSRWEIPDIAILYGGVNDTGTGAPPTPTPATAGAIVVTGGAQFYGVGFVMNSVDGSIFAPPLTAVQLAVGSTGSIALAAGGANSSLSTISVYVTPIGYASAALATASNRLLFLQATLAAATAGSITALAAVTPMPTAGTQAMTQAFCKAMKYGVTGLSSGAAKLNWVLGQANLPANSVVGQRAIVLDDTSATGGFAALLSWQRPILAGNFSASPQQSVWECRTPQAGELGWGRVAGPATAAFAGCCSKIMTVSTNYLNWAAGGDNAGTSTLFASNVAIRALTQAAAAAEGAVYVDLFNFQAGLIASGETSQGGSSWHAIVSNQHHNAYGHDCVARVVTAAIIAQQGWLSTLSL